MRSGRFRFRLTPMGAGVLVTGAGCAALWFGFDLLPPTRPARHASPSGLAYCPPDFSASTDRTSAQAIWSPLLFALPTPAGFSRGVSRGLSLAPPLDPPPMPLPPEPISASIRFAAEPEMPKFPALPHFVPPRPAMPPPPAMQVELVEGGDMRSTPFPVPDFARGDAAWSAEVSIDLDAAGVPERVLVESATAPAGVRNEIARGVHQWRGAPSGMDARVRARIVYAGGRHDGGSP